MEKVVKIKLKLATFSLTLLCFLQGVFCFGAREKENSEIEALKLKLAKSLIDTNRVNILQRLGGAYYDFFPDSTIYYDLKALELAKELNYSCLNLYLDLGYVYYSKKANYNKAKEFFELALEICTDRNNPLDIEYCYNFLGNIYAGNGDWEKGLKYLLAGLKICDSLDNKEGIAQYFNDLGLLFLDLGEKEKAFNYLNKSIKIRETLGDDWGLTQTYYSLAIIFEEYGEFDEALSFYLKSYDIAKKGKIKEFEGLNASHIGKIYINKAQYQLSEEYHQNGLIIARETQNLELESISHLYIAISSYRQLDYNKSLIHSLKALAISKKAKYRWAILTAYEHLASTNEKLGAFKDAYYYHKKFKNIADSINDLNEIDKINKIHVDYEFEAGIKTKRELKEKCQMQKEVLQREVNIRNTILVLIKFIVIGFVFGKESITGKI